MERERIGKKLSQGGYVVKNTNVQENIREFSTYSLSKGYAPYLKQKAYY